ncbi:MAG: hypothetical protein ACD_46C00221G0008 [uncultured bacterium]|nr:MAG: hypothetical protein ACD_46C00221G0008 [uncultured bacterium]
MITKTGIIITTAFFSISAFATDKDCNLANGINIKTTKRILSVCENNKAIKEYKISIGRKGAGKMHEGDKKTPLGIYDLTSPRKSRRFGVFIPIQYPTPQQISAGYTGKDVGIHGPFQLFSWLGSFNTWFNWTQGCIALGSNEEIAFIAKWVENHPGTKVLIS